MSIVKPPEPFEFRSFKPASRGVPPHDAVSAGAVEISGPRDLPVGVDGVQAFVSEAPRAIRVPELDAPGRPVAPQDAVFAASRELSSSFDLPVEIDRVQALVAEAPQAILVPELSAPLDVLRQTMPPSPVPVKSPVPAICQLVLTGFSASKLKPSQLCVQSSTPPSTRSATRYQSSRSKSDQTEPTLSPTRRRPLHSSRRPGRWSPTAEHGHSNPGR